MNISSPDVFSLHILVVTEIIQILVSKYVRQLILFEIKLDVVKLTTSFIIWWDRITEDLLSRSTIDPWRAVIYIFNWEVNSPRNPIRDHLLIDTSQKNDNMQLGINRIKWHNQIPNQNYDSNRRRTVHFSANTATAIETCL